AILDHALDGPPPRSHLPAAVTELVGRDDAITAVRARLGQSRLVTLTGPGGVGKTSLALAAARDAGAAWFVEFAGLDATAGEDEVLTVLGAALGVRDEPGDRLDRLAAALGERRVLLVLDNCEQVVDPVAGVVSRLLRAVPRVHVL